MATSIFSHNDQYSRLEAKLKRELGESILSLLAEEDVEDIVLNPDSSLWDKRRVAGFVPAGTMPPATAASALGTIAACRGTRVESRAPHPRNRIAVGRQPL